MSLFEALVQGGHLRPLDQALATTLRRLDPRTPDLVLAGAALASLAVGNGHAGFDPARPGLLLDVDLPWPGEGAWGSALEASPWVARLSAEGDASQAPLCLDHGLLYLRRYRQYEHRLATRLRSLVARPPMAVGTEGLRAVFDLLFQETRMRLMRPVRRVATGRPVPPRSRCAAACCC